MRAEPVAAAVHKIAAIGVEAERVVGVGAIAKEAEAAEAPR